MKNIQNLAFLFSSESIGFKTMLMNIEIKQHLSYAFVMSRKQGITGKLETFKPL